MSYVIICQWNVPLSVDLQYYIQGGVIIWFIDGLGQLLSFWKYKSRKTLFLIFLSPLHLPASLMHLSAWCGKDASCSYLAPGLWIWMTGQSLHFLNLRLYFLEAENSSWQMLLVLLSQLALGNGQLPNYFKEEPRSNNYFKEEPRSKPFSNFVDLPSQRLKVSVPAWTYFNLAPCLPVIFSNGLSHFQFQKGKQFKVNRNYRSLKLSVCKGLSPCSIFDTEKGSACIFTLQCYLGMPHIW